MKSKSIKQYHQQGGSIKPDATSAHSNIDRLLLEYEMDRDPLSGLAQKPQHVMKRGYHWYETDPEGYNPTEGLPVGAGIKLFRGVPKWFKGQMVKEGTYKSPPNLPLKKMKKQIDEWNVSRTGGAPLLDPEGYYGEYLPSIIKGLGTWASKSKKEALDYAKLGKKGERILLEFDIPNKVFKENIKSASPIRRETWFEGGIPKEYLKKVHKGFENGGVVQNLYSMI